MVLKEIMLGAVQGVTEWLPISSEGLLVFLQANLLGEVALSDLIRYAVFLHLGTFFAALLYLREDVWTLLKAIPQYRESGVETQKTLLFLVVATIATGIVGVGVLQLLQVLAQQVEFTGAVINLLIGGMLLVTAAFQYRTSATGKQGKGDLSLLDGVLVGGLQGLALIPGISRSGITISTLLLRDVEEVDALQLSFLLSLPAILGGNILLNSAGFVFSTAALVGLGVAFLVGFATIHILLRLAEEVEFAHIALLFGVLMLLAGLVTL